jgi:hypothetical protein
MKFYLGISAKCETEEEHQRCKEAGSNPQFGRWWCYWIPNLQFSRDVGIYKYQLGLYWLCFWFEVYDLHSREYLEEKYLA